MSAGAATLLRRSTEVGGPVVGPMYLARFRADPSKLRIAVRRFVQEEVENKYKVLWRATIEVRETGRTLIRYSLSPSRALVRAFQAAEQEHFPGIDRHMGWAYEHPQKHLAPKDRVSVIPF